MANINLLPWREELRQEQQRQFISVLGLVALLGAVVMWSVYIFYSGKIDAQEARNNFLQTEIRKLDSKIKEIELLEKERMQLVERMAIIQDLQKSRPKVVHVFDEIVTTLPEGVNLSVISRKNEQLIFNGVAESGPRISKFMRNIDTSKWIKIGKLETISPDKKSGTNRKNFVLQANIASPSSEQEEK